MSLHDPIKWEKISCGLDCGVCLYSCPCVNACVLIVCCGTGIVLALGTQNE